MICLFNFLFQMSAVVVVFAAGVAAYWLWFDDSLPFVRQTTVVNNAGGIHPGGILVLKVSGCNLKPTVANSGQRVIRNAFTFVLSDTSVGSPGCFNRQTEYPVPQDAHAGPHTYQFCAEFRINPLKTALFCNDPVSFEVTPAN